MKITRLLAAALALLLALTALSGCSNEKKLIGTWINQTETLGVVVETSYTFNENGSGSLTSALGVGLSFDYTVDGDNLTIVTSVLGIASTNVYTFSISGDTLTLTKDGTSTVLTKQ